MVFSDRLRPLVVSITLAGATLGLAPNPAGAADDVAAWADAIWTAARRGDLAAVEGRLAHPPANELPDSVAARLRESYTGFVERRREADAARAEERDKAREALRTAKAEGHLAEALRKAVAIQTLSDHLDSAFADRELMEIVEWADRRVPDLEANREWLEAQELLYLLRTFYDDTSRADAFRRYDEHLEMVNQRVGLLSRYAPKRLYDMRSERAVAEGEEPLPAFDPAWVVDWRERLDGVDHRLLLEALRQAASEHIEAKGWRPLLEGGLESVELLVTTAPLSESLPALSDAAMVGRFVQEIGRLRGRVGAERDLGQRDCSRLLNDLVEANASTVRLPTELLLREFGDGAMARLDTYSDIVWPDGFRRFQQQTEGNFVGVGILIRHNDKREIEVVNPLEGTPAYLAGVKPQDLIVEVDGDPTAGWSLNDAVDRITGKKGSTVRLGLKREGVEDTVEIGIVRDVIKIRSVKGWEKVDAKEDGEPVWNWYVDPAARIAYIRLTQFTDSSYLDLLSAWDEIGADGPPAGLVFDLRHNPGGLLTAAVRISNLFVPRGEIVTGEDKDQHSVWSQKAYPNLAPWAGIPTVVLINKGSASASEIVSGSLQAHGAAVIVGERSFGKGSVQTVHPIASNAKLKLTTQYYRLPSPDGGATPGRLVHRRPGATDWGVDPDIVVPMSVTQVRDAIELRQNAEALEVPADDPNGRPRPKADVNDLIAKGIDPQLEAAVLLLQAQAMARADVRHAMQR